MGKDDRQNENSRGKSAEKPPNHQGPKTTDGRKKKTGPGAGTTKNPLIKEEHPISKGVDRPRETGRTSMKKMV